MMKILGYTINQIKKDQFGRKSGILALDKPKGITSHDLVDRVRKKVGIQKVGHAGALDPFATGLMIILIGKATKLSNKLLHLDKEYVFDMLLGVSTDTQDPDGTIINQYKTSINISNEKINKILINFKGSHMQHVPIYSSVKINGIRLRELAHEAKKIKKIQKNNTVLAYFKFNNSKIKSRRVLTYLNGKNEIKVRLPTRKVEILDIHLISIYSKTASKIDFLKDKSSKINYQVVTVKATVSKGTYIRQLAEDIGMRLGELPACLVSLQRTQIGTIPLSEIKPLEKIV